MIDEPGLTLPQRHGVRWVHGSREDPIVQFGIYTVGDIAPDRVTGRARSESERIRNTVRIARRAGQLEGRTSVVTGGTTGIGLATAVRSADEGAHVSVTGRREAGLQAAVTTIGTDRVTAVAGDISSMADLDRLYDAVGARGEGVDVLVANAGVGSFVTLEQTTEEHVDEVSGVNARGILFTVVSPAWIETPGGTAAFGDEETARPSWRTSLRRCPGAGRAGPRRPPRSWPSWPRERAATSTARTSTSTAARTRSEPALPTTPREDRT